MNSFKEFVLGLILGAIGKFDIYIAEAQAILTDDLFSTSTYNSMLTIAEYLKPICLSIITIGFLIEFLKITMKMDILKWEYGLRVFAKLCIAQATLTIAPKALTAIYATAAEWITKVVGGGVGSGMGDAAQNALTTLFEDLSFWSALGLVVSIGLMFIIISLCGLMIKVMAYARMFEIYVYVAVSPLPCSFLPLEDSGGSRITKKYFMGFAAVCLQGLMIIIVMEIFDTVVGASLAQAIANTAQSGADGVASICFNMLLGALVLTMAVAKSGSWAKQMLDAM